MPAVPTLNGSPGCCFKENDCGIILKEFKHAYYICFMCHVCWKNLNCYLYFSMSTVPRDCKDVVMAITATVAKEPQNSKSNTY